MERYDITLRVIECIDLMGDLYTSIRFRGISPESTGIYEAFVNSFFKIFHITASMLKEGDIDTITEVEEALMSDIFISPETVDKFLKLFESYLFAMKKAGIYDPMVVRKFINPADAWTDSV
jgi:hypothetical protein